MRSHLWLTLLLLGTLFARSVHAQDSASDEAARRHFESGRAYFDRAQYDEAIREFEEAYRLSERPELLLNVSRAYEAAGRHDRAVAALEQWLAVAAQSDQRRTEIQTRISRLQRQAESIEAERRATEAQLAREDEAREAAQVEGTTTSEVEPTSVPAPAPVSHRSPLGLVLIGSGAAAAGVGALFVALGYRDVRTVEHPDAGSTWASSADEYDRAPTRIGVGYGLLGLGVASCIVGVVLRVGSDDEAPVAVHVAPNGLSVRGTF